MKVQVHRLTGSFREEGALRGKETIQMTTLQRVDEVREKLSFIKRTIDSIYHLYANDCFSLMDKDSVLYTLWGVSEAIDEAMGLIEEDEWDNTNLPS